MFVLSRSSLFLHIQIGGREERGEEEKGEGRERERGGKKGERERGKGLFDPQKFFRGLRPRTPLLITGGLRPPDPPCLFPL